MPDNPGTSVILECLLELTKHTEFCNGSPEHLLAHNGFLEMKSKQHQTILEQCQHCQVIFTSDKEYVAHKCDGKQHQKKTADIESLPSGNQKERFSCLVPQKQAGYNVESSSVFHQTPVSIQHQDIVPIKLECFPRPEVEKLTNDSQDASILAGSIQCSICNVKYENILEYTNHLKQHSSIYDEANPETKYFKYPIGSDCDSEEHVFHCKHCLKIFTSKHKCDMHTLIHMVPDPLKCSVCTKYFASHSQLQDHMETHREQALYICTFCQKAFKMKEHLLAHTLTHTKTFKCGQCDMIFAHRTQLQEHIASHNEEHSNKCVYCEKTYKTTRQLNQHIIIHTHPDRYKCSICDASFVGRRQLENHMTRHSDDRPFSCTLCRKTYKLQNHIDRHIHLNHMNPDGSYICSVCSKSFSSSALLKSHAASHNDDDPFCCRYCDKTFRLQKDFVKHILIHSDPNRFKCSVCSMGFGEKRILKKHTASHRVKCPFKCTFCAKTFKLKKQLILHIVNHTGSGQNIPK